MFNFLYKTIICFILLIFLFKCSSGSIYNFNSNLSKESIISRFSNFKIILPEDWFVADDDGNSKIDICLVKNDYSASIKFSPILINEFSDNSLIEIPISKIASVEMDLIKNKMGKNFKGFNNIENLMINDKNFSAFEFLDIKSYPIRVVIFEYQNIYYEVTATTKNISEQKSLFDLQNTILKSIN